MKDRCYNKNSSAFSRYGGRGIFICEEWRHDFAAFFNDMGQKPSARHSIERIDNDGPYGPENCRWATQTEQGRNRSNNLLVEVGGERKPLSEWCHQFNIDRTTVLSRLKRGWAAARAVTTPARKMTVRIVPCNSDVPRRTVASRLSHGWSLERAMSQPLRKSPTKATGRHEPIHQ